MDAPATPRHDRGGPRRTRRLALGALAMVGLILLGAPSRLLALLARPGGPSPVAASPLAEPAAPAPDTVVDTAEADPDAAAEPGTDAAQGRWGVTPARPPAAGFLIEELRAGWRVEAGNEEAAALAAIAAHAWAVARSAPSTVLQRTEGAVEAGAMGTTGAVGAVGAVGAEGP